MARQVLKAVLFALAVLSALPASAGDQAARYPDGVSRKFSDWTVTCDTVHTCWAQAFAENYEMSALTLKREAGPEGKLEIIAFGNTENLAFDVPGFEAALTGAEQALDTDQGAGGLVMAEAQTGLFVDALRHAGTLSDGGSVTISLAGASAAIRLIDEVQGRAGTVTALVAKGGKPSSAVPPAPAMPVISAPKTRAYGIENEPGADLKAAAIAACGGDEEPDFDAMGARLEDGREIWLMPCSNGMYNFLYAALLKDGNTISSIAFTGPKEGGPAAAELSNLWNPEIITNEKGIEVPDTPLTMTTFGRGRSIGDCGAMTKYVWTGKAFALVSNVEMNHCRGLSSQDWPTRWQAEVVGE